MIHNNYGKIPDIGDSESPLQYLLDQHNDIINLIHERHQEKLVRECKIKVLSALLYNKDRTPRRTFLHNKIINHKQETLLQRISRDECFKHLSIHEQTIASHLLISYIKLDEVDVPDSPMPPILIETEEDLMEHESPLSNIKQCLDKLNDTSPGSLEESKIIDDLFTVYIPGFVGKNVSEINNSDYDDITMKSIESLEYPYVLPHKQERTDKYIKEKYEEFRKCGKDNNRLTQSQRDSLYKVLCEHEKVFSLHGENLGSVDLVQHEINTDPHRVPFREKLRVYSTAIQEIIDKEIEKMIKDGVIVPSKSPYASNVLLVRKPDLSSVTGMKERVCIDYRRLNKDTVKDSYPLANIQTIFNRIGRSDGLPQWIY